MSLPHGRPHPGVDPLAAPDATSLPAASGARWQGPVAFVGTLLVTWWMVERVAGVDAFGDAWRRVSFDPSAGIFDPALLAILVLNFGLSVVRWGWILAAMGYRVRRRRLAYAILATWPMAVFTPSRASDVLRAFCIRDRVPVYSGAGSVVVEKMVDVQSLALLALSGALMHGLWHFVWLPLAILVAAWGGVIVLFWQREPFLQWRLMRRWEQRFRRTLAPLDGLRAHPGYFLAVALSSLASWMTAVLLLDALLELFGARVPFSAMLSLWPVAMFAGLVPITVAGMGTRDGAFVFLLEGVAGLTLDRGAVTAATLGFSFIATWLLAFGGLPFMLHFLLRTWRLPQNPGDAP